MVSLEESSDCEYGSKFKKVFITGGGGYVGSALVPKLLQKGHEVTVYDLFIYGEGVLPYNHPNLKLIKGDIRNREFLMDEAKGHEAFIHLACISNDPSFELNPTLGKEINLDAFLHVIDAVKSGGIERLIVASSTSQYGIQKGVDVVEDVVGEPITDYAKYKLECEKMLKATDMGDVDYVCVRPATLCGYAPRLRLDLSLNLLTMQALENKRITVFGGDQLRPTLNIEDMVRGYQLMLSAPSEKIRGQAFNMAYENISVREMARLIKETLGDEGVVIEETSTNDLRSYHVNSNKIRDQLGFTPRHSLKDGIASVAKAYSIGLIKDGLNNPLYHNVKRMKQINLDDVKHSPLVA